MKKLVVKVGKAKESGNTYRALILDLGYRKVFLSNKNDRAETLCAEAMGLTLEQLFELEHDEYEIMSER